MELKNIGKRKEENMEEENISEDGKRRVDLSNSVNLRFGI